MNIKRLLPFALAVVPFFAAGCGEEKFATNSNSANNATAGTDVVSPTTVMPVDEPPSVPGKYGGTLTSSTISDPKSLNLWIAGENSTSGAVGPLYDALIERNPYTLQWEGALAELPKISDDGKTWTFQLKENLKWSDGKPITADDVIFTFDLLYDPKVETLAREELMLDVPGKDGKSARQPIKYRKIDDRTVEFVFPIEYAVARNVLAQAIAPKHKLYRAWKQGQPAKTAFNATWGVNTPVSELVSSGPWILSEYRSGQRLVYKRNPNYWKKDSEGRPLPYLDQRVLLIVRNITTMTIKFRAKETDTLGIQPSDYPVIKKDESSGNYTVRDLGPSWGFEYLCFNQNPKAPIEKWKVALFSNLKFRQACSHAMNRKRMIQDVYRGFAVESYSSESPANKLFFNADVQKYPYDPAKAKALLAEIGLKDTNGDGIVEYRGNPVKFNIITNGSNETRKSICTILTDDLRSIGLGAQFTPLDFNAIVTKLDASYDWDATILGFGGGPEPNDGANIWRSSAISHQWWPKQKKPATAWEAEVDDIFAKGARTLDEAERRKLYLRWQELTAENLPFIYTPVQNSLSAVRNRFGNLKPTSYGGVLWNIEEIYDLKATRDTP